MVATSLYMGLLLASASPADSRTADISLPDDVVRVGHIAHVPFGQDLVIARLPSTVSALSLDEDQRRELLQRRLPGIAFRLRHRGTVKFERPSKWKARFQRACYASRIDLASAAYLDRADLMEVECATRPIEQRLGYDRGAGAPITRAPIPAGTYLGHLRVDDRAPLPVGEKMVLRTRVGVAAIERTVTNIQPARPGRRVFVRTADGDLLAALWDGHEVGEGH